MTESGVESIAAERKRQLEQEGYSYEWDDEKKGESLARAAACYAMPRSFRILNSKSKVPLEWPWFVEDWKPTPEDREKELIKAGALIAAELDRLRRIK
jgi:hypothetical protein